MDWYYSYAEMMTSHSFHCWDTELVEDGLLVVVLLGKHDAGVGVGLLGCTDCGHYESRMAVDSCVVDRWQLVCRVAILLARTICAASSALCWS